jgi:hypothetical protein
MLPGLLNGAIVFPLSICQAQRSLGKPGRSSCIFSEDLAKNLEREAIGRVAIVTPIATSYSLFTLFLSYLFLRDMERMSSKIIFGTILIVGGVILLSLVK